MDDRQGAKPIQFRQTVVRENQIGRRGGEFVAQFTFGSDARHEEIKAVSALTSLKSTIGMIGGPALAGIAIASIGLSEQKAKEQGIEIKVGRFPFYGNDSHFYTCPFSKIMTLNSILVPGL